MSLLPTDPSELGKSVPELHQDVDNPELKHLDGAKQAALIELVQEATKDPEVLRAVEELLLLRNSSKQVPQAARDEQLMRALELLARKSSKQAALMVPEAEEVTLKIKKKKSKSRSILVAMGLATVCVCASLCLIRMEMSNVESVITAGVNEAKNMTQEAKKMEFLYCSGARVISWFPIRIEGYSKAAGNAA